MDDALTGVVEPVSFVQPVEEDEQFEADALAVASVGADPRWATITDYCDERISYYRDNLAGMDVTGQPLAQVGEKYLVCNLVAMELQALLDKVRVTTEAVNGTRN